MKIPISILMLAAGCSLCAADSPVETDSRLQADGKGWRLDQAKIVDPARPRVLLIGDSILNGYLKQVVTALEGKADVDAWVNPYCQSENTNRMAAEVMAEMGVPVNDFYALLVDKRELARGDRFHWTAPAYQLLADQVVKSILAAIPNK